MDKKILIISEEQDSSTNTVLKWIKHLGGTYLRINDTSKLTLKNIKLNTEFDDVIFEYDGFIYKMSEFTGYWYRRGRMNFQYEYFNFSNKSIENSVNRMLNNEHTYVNNYIYEYVEKNKKIKSIGSIHNNKINKITALLKAKQYGLEIPDTLITSSKKELLLFKNKHKKILTKPIYQRGLEFSTEDNILTGLSSILTDDDILNANDSFSLSLIQVYVEKKIELRIFFLGNKFFSSAIFSQNDEMTKIDFRNYNWEKPNRTPPYDLPNRIEKKIKSCMKALNLNSGSIDMIVTPNDDYIFLEVNPVGMFWQVSFPCNYNIEEQIAKYLLDEQ